MPCCEAWPGGGGGVTIACIAPHMVLGISRAIASCPSLSILSKLSLFKSAKHKNSYNFLENSWIVWKFLDGPKSAFQAPQAASRGIRRSGRCLVPGSGFLEAF